MYIFKGSKTLYVLKLESDSTRVYVEEIVMKSGRSITR